MDSDNIKPERNYKGLLIWLVVLALAVVVYGFITAKNAQEQADTKAAEVQRAAEQKVEEAPKPVELPFGGRTILPTYRYVGLYGTPSMPVLGALGKQDVPATIARVQALAAEYQPYSTEKVIPTLEIIATVASSGPTSNGDYSQEIDAAKLEPLVMAAKAAGVYVVLDLQPGRVSFLDQVKLYESLFKEPHVGLALDPEWRIKPDQVHLKQIGSVDPSEVNQVSTWLADLVKANDLPQKVFLLHQFKLSMLPGRETIDTSRPELGFVIQMDGQGNQNVKLDTWRNIVASPPANTFFGWKNFYEKDQPVRSPADTMAIEPKPWFVSYQ